MTVGVSVSDAVTLGSIVAVLEGVGVRVGGTKSVKVCDGVQVMVGVGVSVRVGKTMGVSVNNVEVGAGVSLGGAVGEGATVGVTGSQARKAIKPMQ